jgi:hypothetical protein
MVFAPISRTCWVEWVSLIANCLNEFMLMPELWLAYDNLMDFETPCQCFNGYSLDDVISLSPKQWWKTLMQIPG